MAGFFHARQVGDLAVGKPPLHKYPKALSVGAALKALRSSDDAELSLWEELCPLTEKPIKEARELVSHVPSSNHPASPCPPQSPKENLWRCVGKLGMVDLICFLAHDQSLADQAAALRTPVSSLVPDTAFTIQHVDSRIKLIDALAHVLDGAQHLVVSIDRSVSSRLARYNSMPKVRRGVPQLISNKPKGQPGKCTLDATLSLPPRSPAAAAAHGVQQEYCWLTPEDLLQFLLSCIGLFSPLPMMTIQQLGIINMDVLTVPADAQAATALPLIQRASKEMTAVAVLEPDDKLVGDISPFTLRSSDETAALALATLSVREFLAFSRDCDNPPPSLVHLVATKLASKLQSLPTSQEPLFSDSDSPVSFPSPLSSTATSPLAFYALDSGEESAPSSDEDIFFSSGMVVRRSRAHSYSKGRVAPNVCRPWSSLVAVMAQALTHRVGYIWVTDDDNSLLGIVTYLDIIHCILGQLYASD